MLIGLLLYLTANRPLIAFVVGVCARFQCNPKQTHLEAARIILRYLKGTINLGLWYPVDDGLELSGYSDTDFGIVELIESLPLGLVNF